jgi:hypothetical protein
MVSISASYDDLANFTEPEGMFNTFPKRKRTNIYKPDCVSGAFSDVIIMTWKCYKSDLVKFHIRICAY